MGFDELLESRLILKDGAWRDLRLTTMDMLSGFG
jgi:hypothetical protein